MIRNETEDGVCIVTIDRPEKAGALSAMMLQDLVAAMEAAQSADAVILTGSGQTFSAGADLGETRSGLITSPLWEEVSSAIAALPSLSIAALNGTVAGGAMGMILACDLRIADPAATFFYPVMKLGFLPQPSDPGRLRALIGPARTKLLLMAGQKLSAQDALDYGLVDRLVASQDLLDTACALARDSRSADPGLRAAIKSICTP
ncbi:MAG: enoyl-CoA hydratase/isomerase family protein [Pseudomonadota bacterium]